jgi:hypothetical protein
VLTGVPGLQVAYLALGSSMALLDDVLNGGNVATGLMVGVGALIAWPLISPVVRSLAKSVIKGRTILLAAGRGVAIEGIGDILTEAQQELGATTPAQGPADRSTSRVI